MVRIHEMRSLAFKLFPREFFEKSGILTKIVENLSFTIWKMAFSNFVGAPRLNRDR